MNAWCRRLGKDNVILISIHANAAGHGDRWYDATGWCAYTSKGNTWNTEEIQYDTETPAPNVTAASFVLPFPNEDVALNPNLASSVEPVHVDVRATFSY